MILLQATHLQAIKDHAEKTYPHECCGLMLGHVQLGPVQLEEHVQTNTTQPQAIRTVVELWPVINAWDETAQATMAQVQDNAQNNLQDNTIKALKTNEPQPSQPSLTTQRRYWIDPKDLLKAQKYARTNGLNIVGIYHSHPDHPAVPSECDRACAWPEYSYIIVSVPNGNASDVFSWTLDDAAQFQSEPIAPC